MSGGDEIQPSGRRLSTPGECLTPVGVLSISGGAPDARATVAREPFSLVDLQRRVVRYLRLGLTDRCNYRCTYCMPAEGVPTLARPELLTFDEIERLVRVFVSLGIDRVRLTGGEPLLRRGVATLVQRLSAIEGLADLAATTNAHLLTRLAEPLRAAGLRRLNVSLDSLDPRVFAALTRKGDLATVLAGLDAADRAGFTGTKLNAVVLRGINDGEVGDLISFAATRGYQLRLIEYMPIGLDDLWGPETFVSGAEMRDAVAAQWAMEPLAQEGGVGGPARPWLASARDGSGRTTQVGFITAVSDHFCTTCNRVRLSPEGTLRECLSSRGRISLRDMLRGGADDAEVAQTIVAALGGKVDGHSYQDEGHTRESMSAIGG